MCLFPPGCSEPIGFLLPPHLQRLLNGDRLICFALIAHYYANQPFFLPASGCKAFIVVLSALPTDLYVKESV